MTLSTTCPTCGATMWRGSLHVCRRMPADDEPHPAIHSKRIKFPPPPPGSSLATTIALWTFAGVVLLVTAWALNSVCGVF